MDQGTADNIEQLIYGLRDSKLKNHNELIELLKQQNELLKQHNELLLKLLEKNS